MIEVKKKTKEGSGTNKNEENISKKKRERWSMRISISDDQMDVEN